VADLLDGKPVHEALAREQLDRVRSGALLDRLDSPSGRPLLVLAAEAGLLAVVQALLEAGAQAKCAADDGDTALIAAARWGHAGVVGSLLRAGADPDARVRGRSARGFAYACTSRPSASWSRPTPPGGGSRPSARV
jgi:ankyrin repeat protein